MLTNQTVRLLAAAATRRRLVTGTEKISRVAVAQPLWVSWMSDTPKIQVGGTSLVWSIL